MAKAHLTLSNGTQVLLEGTPEEVHRLLALTGGTSGSRESPPKKRGPVSKPARRSSTTEGSSADLTEIVNFVKDCDDADAIERNILDRTSTVDRVLLPLFVLSKQTGSPTGLTSGEISKVTIELGVPVSQPNTSTALSGSASKYVMGDKVRRRGQPVRYRLSRRGEQYLAAVIRGKQGED